MTPVFVSYILEVCGATVLLSYDAPSEQLGSPQRSYHSRGIPLSWTSASATEGFIALNIVGLENSRPFLTLCTYSTQVLMLEA